MNDKLLDQVKRYCFITSNDPAILETVNDMISNAVVKVSHLIGITDKNFDFSKAGLENDLLLNYCFYDWNHVANEFKENYLDDILTLRDIHAVKSVMTNENQEVQ